MIEWLWLILPGGLGLGGYIVFCVEEDRHLLSPWLKTSRRKAALAQSKELAIPEKVKRPPVYESYDHPAPPILILSTALPSAPMGFGWEVTTHKGDNDNPWLKLALLNLSTSVEVESIEADLVIVRRWKYANDETYAQFYRRAEAERTLVGYSYISGEPWYNYSPEEVEKRKGKVMMGNLITPMVDWARLVTLRYIVDHPDESKVNYMLIESPEGVPA